MLVFFVTGSREPIHEVAFPNPFIVGICAGRELGFLMTQSRPKGVKFAPDFSGWGFGEEVDQLSADLVVALAEGVSEGFGASLGLWMTVYTATTPNRRGEIKVEAYIQNDAEEPYASKILSITELVGGFLDQYEDEAERRPDLKRLADELHAMEDRIRRLLDGPPHFVGGRVVR